MADVINYGTEGVNDVREIAELGARASGAREVEHGEVYLSPRTDKDWGTSLEVIEVPAAPLYSDRAINARTVTNADAFVDYVNRHGGPLTEVWADAKQNRVVGVIDGNASNNAPADVRFGWEQHRVTLMLEHTSAWNDWVSGQRITEQVQFAEFIEDHAEDVVSPSSAELLEIAQTLHGSSKAEFKSGQRLSNGESQLAFIEDIQGKAGKSGNLTIPDEFQIGLRPYIGGELYGVTAKLRWRLNQGHVSIFYKLLNLERTLEVAFEDMTKKISEGIGYPMFNGRP